jgi:hypothetical protein
MIAPSGRILVVKAEDSREGTLCSINQRIQREVEPSMVVYQIAFGRQRQEDHKLEPSLGNIVGSRPGLAT